MRGWPSSWSISTSSVDPPPMSKISAGPSPGSSSLWQPRTASRASSCGSMMSSTMPVSSRTRSAKSLAVLGAAAGLGRDRARQRDVAAPELVGADGRARRPRGPSRSCDSSPLRRESLAQPDDARESIDDGEAAVVRPGDQQPAIVGAEVDRAIGVAMRAPASARSWSDGPLCSHSSAAEPAHWRHPAP